MLPPELGPEGRYLVGLLAALRSVVRRDAAARAALAWGAAVLAAWAGLVLADAAFGFPASARPFLYAAAGGIGAAAWAGATAAAHRRRPTAMYLAHQAERARPDLKNALVTFLELAGRDSAADRAACKAVGRRAARVLADAAPEALVVRPALVRRGMAAGAAAGLLAASIWLSQGILFRPWARSAEAGGVPTRRHGDLPVAARSGAAGAQAGAVPLRAAGGVPLRAAGGSPPLPDLGASPARADPGAGATTAALGQGDGAPSLRSGQALAVAARNSAAADPSSAAGLNDKGSLAGQGPLARSGGPEGSAALALARDLAASPGAFDRLAAALGQAAAAGAASAAGAEAGAVPLQAAGAMPFRAAGGSPPLPDPGASAAGAASAASAAGSGPGGRAPGGGPPSGAGAGAPPIPEQPQPVTLPREALDTTRWAERLIGEADRRLQEGEVSDGLLKDMGMSPVEFRRFVTTWKRRFDGAGGPDSTPPAAGVRTLPAGPAGRVLDSSGADSMRPIADAGPPGAGAGHAEEGDSPVVPRLRPYVAAYFEAVGRAQPGRAPNEKR